VLGVSFGFVVTSGSRSFECMGMECSPYGFYAGESPGISTSRLPTLGLHPWLAGVMPFCCGLLNQTQRKISLSKNLWFWVFEKFQRIKGVL
jgi:hypothetical protein